MQCHNSDSLLPDQLQTQSPGVSRMDVKYAHLLRLFGRLHTISSHQVNKWKQMISRCFHDLIALRYAFKPIQAFKPILGHIVIVILITFQDNTRTEATVLPNKIHFYKSE